MLSPIFKMQRNIVQFSKSTFGQRNNDYYIRALVSQSFVIIQGIAKD